MSFARHPLPWADAKAAGAEIDYEWTNHTISNIVVRYAGQTFDSKKEIREHCYCCPNETRAFAFFKHTSQFQEFLAACSDKHLAAPSPTTVAPQ